jgi:hypothetical protein
VHFLLLGSQGWTGRYPHSEIHSGDSRPRIREAGKTANLVGQGEEQVTWEGIPPAEGRGSGSGQGNAMCVLKTPNRVARSG